MQHCKITIFSDAVGIVIITTSIARKIFLYLTSYDDCAAFKVTDLLLHSLFTHQRRKFSCHKTIIQLKNNNRKIQICTVRKKNSDPPKRIYFIIHKKYNFISATVEAVKEPSVLCAEPGIVRPPKGRRIFFPEVNNTERSQSL